MRIRGNTLVLLGCVTLSLASPAVAATPKMDFNGDGYGDLAIGAPIATVNGKSFGGRVTVIYGNPTGLVHDADTEHWDMDRPDVPGTAQVGDGFGYALAAGDFNADGFSDLAIGVRSGFGSSTLRYGQVIVIHGSIGGLQALIASAPGTVPRSQA